MTTKEIVIQVVEDQLETSLIEGVQKSKGFNLVTETLREMGADELDAVQVALMLEHLLGVHISDDDLTRLDRMSVLDIVSHVEAMKKR